MVIYQITPSQEDYLEAILLIQKNKKVARVKEIASHLSIKGSSVIESIRNLKSKGFIKQERYGFIELTDKGKKAATKVYKRHEIIETFLLDVLKLPKEIAAKDACQIEHFLSKETINKMLKAITK